MKLHALFGSVVGALFLAYDGNIAIVHIKLCLVVALALGISLDSDYDAGLYYARKLLFVLGSKRVSLDEYRRVAVKKSEGNVEFVSRAVCFTRVGKDLADDDNVSDGACYACDRSRSYRKGYTYDELRL